MTDKESDLNKKIAQAERAEITRFAAEYLLLLCNPKLIDIYPEQAMHVLEASSEQKAGFIAELQKAGAMEVVEGTYTVTSKGREINNQLFAAAARLSSARPFTDTPEHVA